MKIGPKPMKRARAMLLRSSPVFASVALSVQFASKARCSCDRVNLAADVLLNTSCHAARAVYHLALLSRAVACVHSTPLCAHFRRVLSRSETIVAPSYGSTLVVVGLLYLAATGALSLAIAHCSRFRLTTRIVTCDRASAAGHAINRNCAPAIGPLRLRLVGLDAILVSRHSICVGRNAVPTSRVYSSGALGRYARCCKQWHQYEASLHKLVHAKSLFCFVSSG